MRTSTPDLNNTWSRRESLGTTLAASMAIAASRAATASAQAIRFRLGGRMSRNADSRPGRGEALIPLARKTFGDAMTLYADANSPYHASTAIRIGRLIEEHKCAMFEEPCEFDDLWAIKEVSDALTIPIGLGEQEFSMRRFQWVIENRAADIIQPDLHYFGGYIRCTKVARMAAAAGMPCTLHLSEKGLGYLNAVTITPEHRTERAGFDLPSFSKILQRLCLQLNSAYDKDLEPIPVGSVYV